ncbi:MULTISPECIES: S1 family peptidase [Actinosynnema]|uniref:S1 family peptidase n=1 Tax=Actinosynnema TaxID=40566 RepID=UPI0020A54845|nr:S1 family peptidase [Actinosynnema pretiosum]MCP2094767.1 Alpha-lytic protease prodomain-containing protein [Actinosynnema pretiosum]
MHALLRLAVVGASIAALTAGATAAPRTATAAPSPDAGLISAMRRDLGLTEAQSVLLREKQDAAITLDGALRGTLGTAFAGSWFDPADGVLTVNVSDPARASDVEKAGGRARVVTRTSAELEAIKAEIDNAFEPGRSPSAAGSPTSGLESWHVDPKSNRVVVSVIEGQHPAVLDALARHGDAVAVEHVEQAAETTKWMNGGEEIHDILLTSCSAGFNVRNPENGKTFLLTAGHCFDHGDWVFGNDLSYFGDVVASYFPKWDHGLIEAKNTSHWQQGPYVQSDPANGGYITVGPAREAPVGTAMCKYGVTTQWTCGTIVAKDKSVTYAGESEPVNHLTQTNACSEPGDSGGANVAYTPAWTAEGMTSGGALVEVDGAQRCLAAVGRANRSYYYPVAKALEFYGPNFGVSLM